MDFDFPEGSVGNTIDLVKISNNDDPIDVRISFFTYEEFANSGFSELASLLPTPLPDAAERKCHMNGCEGSTH